jgi:hypothetical protein
VKHGIAHGTPTLSSTSVYLIAATSAPTGNLKMMDGSVDAVQCYAVNSLQTQQVSRMAVAMKATPLREFVPIESEAAGELAMAK